MKILTFVKKNLIIIVSGGIFLIWMLFLIITSINSSLNPKFYDVLNQVDVSDQYTIETPGGRYIWEPFAALNFLFVNNITAIVIVFVLAYVLFRILYLLFSRFIFKDSQKLKTIAPFIRKVVNFYPKYFGWLFLVGFAIVGISYLAGGFLWANNIFMDVLQVFIIIWTVVYIAKIFHVALYFFSKKAKLRVRPQQRWKSLSKKDKKYWKHKIPAVISREFRYSLFALATMALLLTNSLTIHYPTQTIRPLNSGPDEFLCDFHCHTLVSDGWITVQERIDWYVEQGIDIIALTDHENTLGVQQAREYAVSKGYDITILYGQEFTYYEPYIHLNIFGLEKVYVPESLEGYPGDPWGQDRYPNQMNLTDMITDVHANGGWVIVNHYKYDPGDDAPYTYQQLMDWGVDGFEIVNGGYRYGEARDFCVSNSLICVASTDEHLNGEINTFTRIKLADPNNRTVDAVFNALKNHSTTQCVDIEKYEDKIKFPEWASDLDFIEDFSNYFLSIDPLQSLSWMLWSFGGFILLIAIFNWLKKLKVGKIESKIEVDP
ncbi:MAG: PHP domain-containing protein, partial [Candidatus Hodarchaeota archaeon]